MKVSNGLIDDVGREYEISYMGSGLASVDEFVGFCSVTDL